MAQKNTNFYDLLRVPRTASIHEINQSYRKLAREFHPDKNPLTGDIFKEISYAHEVLTDQNKRYLYDQYGIEGLQGNVRRETPVNFSDLFPHMSFGCFFDFPPGMGLFTYYSPFHQRVEDTVCKIAVTLEELYHGRTIKYSINRKIVCVACHGKGSKSGVRHFCHRCLGTGHPLGSSILSITVSCADCSGVGFFIPSHDRCVYCTGAGVFPENVIVDVIVEKGMKDGERIVLHGQGDQAPGAEPGNIVFVLEQQPHDFFLRLGRNLFVNKDINLTEALCGCTFPLQHLDGTILKVILPAGNCIETGKNRALPTKGMPVRGRLDCWGTLYVTFNIKFPSNNFATESQLKILESVLGPRSEFTMPSTDDTEEVDMLDFDPKQDPNYQKGYSKVHIFDKEEDDPLTCASQ